MREINRERLQLRFAEGQEVNFCGARKDRRKSLQVILSYEEEIDFGKNMTSLGGKKLLYLWYLG